MGEMGAKRTILVDNGSLNPAATLRLRELAALVSARLGERVDPVSVLHSDKIDPAELGGTPARTFEEYAREAKASGCAQMRVIPLFIGPSLALTEFLPELSRKVDIGLEVLRTLWTPGDCEALLRILADNLRTSGWRPGIGTVLLCDHGSPIPAVTAARDDLARRLRGLLSLGESDLVACSMERREGPAYAFNEPMLAEVIQSARGEVTVLMLFLLPGRHAGPGGDVATICAASAPSGNSWRLSPLIGEHPALADQLAAAASGR